MYVFFSQSVCVLLYICLCSCFCLYICLSVFSYIYVCLFLSINLSVCFCLPVSLSTRLTIWLLPFLFVHSFCVCVCLSIHLIFCLQCHFPFKMSIEQMPEWYGKLQCYSSQSCSARKTIGSKHLSKNTLNVDCTVYIVSKYLHVDMASCDSQKYFLLI
jgi:hypothetical protein